MGDPLSSCIPLMLMLLSWNGGWIVGSFYQELLGVEVLGSLDSYDECVYSDDGTVTLFNSRKETE